MDLLISVRKEWYFWITKRYDEDKNWAYGLFVGPICIVITNKRLLRG